MRVLLSSVLAVLLVMSVIANRFVRREVTAGREVIDSYYAAGDETTHEQVAAIMAEFRRRVERAALPEVERSEDLLLLSDQGEQGALRAGYDAAFSEAYLSVTGSAVQGTPRLVWSTGPNPARQVQMALFREWHLREFGEPVDIVADPSNRDLTKSIVQSVAGAGPDLIEYIGASHLRNLVRAGIAQDITEYAEQNGFGVGSVFPAVSTTIAMENQAGELRQYGYPCNLDYRVLLYHRDLFRQAGEPEPEGGWSFDEMLEVGERVMASEDLTVKPQFLFMNHTAFDASLAAGGRLFAEGFATHSVYNSPETVRGLREFQELMYTHGAMPRPAEVVSMSATSAGGFGGIKSVSAPGLFSRRLILLHVGGRWEYVVFALTNRDDVYLPAIERRLAELPKQSEVHEVLLSTRASLLRDVLLPLSEDQLVALRGCLTKDDQRQLLDIGVAHLPTTTGTPYYSVSARCTVVNRALETRDPQRFTLARRFVQFLGSAEYNEQVNGTFDSICGRIEFCLDEDGISDSPPALPGLEEFDSAVFHEAVLQHGDPRQLSPFVGRNRLLTLVNEVLEDIQSDSSTPEDAAFAAEEAINRQILANLKRDARLRATWIEQTGMDPSQIQPGLRDANGDTVSIRSQVEAGISSRASGRASGGAS